MLLTLPMAICGVAAGMCQYGAHQWMKNRTYPTPIPRYAVGSFFVLLWFAFGWGMDTAQHPISGLVYLYGTSLIATWIGYEKDRPRATEKDTARIIATIVGEHTDDDSTDARHPR